MALLRKKRNQSEDDFGNDLLTACNDISEPNCEMKSKHTGKSPLAERARMKKRTSAFMRIFAALVVICLGILVHACYISQNSPKNKRNMIHIQFASNKETVISDYEKDKQALQERIKIFADGRRYSFEETGHYYDVYLPIECFGDERVENVCRRFLSSTGRLYFVDKEDEQQILPVEILPEYIESITPKHVKSEDDDCSYDYLEVALNLDGQQYYAEELSAFRSLTVSRDVLDDPGSYKPVYYTYSSETTKSFPDKWGSFIIKEKASFPTELELTEYFLVHDSLEHHFDFSVEYPVVWEHSGNVRAGKNQVNVKDLEENDLIVVFQNVLPETEETILDEYEAIKSRCDALDRPYAFGTLDEYGAFAIKMSPKGISYPVLKLLVASPQSLDIHIGSWIVPTEAVADITVEESPSGAGRIKVNIIDDELGEKLRVLSTENPELPIYLSARCESGLLNDDLYLFRGTLGETSDGEILLLNKSCYCDFLGTEDDASWPFEFFRAVSETAQLPIAYNISVGNGNIQSEKLLAETLKRSVFYSELLKDINQIAPDAEILFPDSVDDSSDELYIQLNFEIDDELPRKSLDAAMKIYNRIGFTYSEFDTLRIVFIEEENERDEWARVLFQKCPVKTLEERNRSGSMGAFSNGRVSPYQSVFRSCLLSSPFYRELGKNYQYYFRTSQGKSGWSFSHTIYTSGIHYSVR